MEGPAGEASGIAVGGGVVAVEEDVVAEGVSAVKADVGSSVSITFNAMSMRDTLSVLTDSSCEKKYSVLETKAEHYITSILKL